jgi:hypothetical protein
MAEGRGSDFNLEMPEGLDEQTVFQMSDPADDIQPTSPIVISRMQKPELQKPRNLART